MRGGECTARPSGTAAPSPVAGTPKKKRGFPIDLAVMEELVNARSPRTGVTIRVTPLVSRELLILWGSTITAADHPTRVDSK